MMQKAKDRFENNAQSNHNPHRTPERPSLRNWVKKKLLRLTNRKKKEPQSLEIYPLF
jgi:hypothetical protein